jgi:hypothetical protein
MIVLAAALLLAVSAQPQLPPPAFIQATTDWMTCLNREVEQAGTEGTPEAVADAALLACRRHVERSSTLYLGWLNGARMSAGEKARLRQAVTRRVPNMRAQLIQRIGQRRRG